MRACPECRWFVQAGAYQVDGETFVYGSCNRPEGPLDPRTTRGQVYEHHGHTMTQPAGIAVSAVTGQVSSGMGCRAHEARDPDKVTKVTDSEAPQPDLWGRP